MDVVSYEATIRFLFMITIVAQLTAAQKAGRKKHTVTLSVQDMICSLRSVSVDEVRKAVKRVSNTTVSLDSGNTMATLNNTTLVQTLLSQPQPTQDFFQP